MRGTSRTIRALLGVTAVAVAAVAASAAVLRGGTASFDALVFTKTAGYRHESIPAAIGAVRGLGDEHGFRVAATEDAGAFTDANLARYEVVVFLLTSGDVLNKAQQAAFERYVRAGGGYAGVHSASNTEYDWPFYGELVGAYEVTHPAIQSAVVVVPDRAHPSTESLPQRWTRTDEWYKFDESPRARMHVLATLDESTYTAGEGAMGADHPIAWCRVYRGGRAWYTGGGHTVESYSEKLFRAHLSGGIRWAAGAEPGACAGGPDTTAPRVLARASEGRAGRVANLRYAATDDRAVTRVRVRIWRRGKLVATLAGPRWPAAGQRAGRLRFCVVAWDVVGNRSPASCASLVLRR